MYQRLYHLTRPTAAVKVSCKSNRACKQYVVEVGSGISVIASGTELLALGENDTVITPDGETVEPTGKFYRTAYTIDPYHLVLDIFDTSAVS